MPGQVDSPRQDSDIHEEVDNATLNVPDDPVHQEPLAHIEYFNKRQVLVEFLIDSFVFEFVEADPLEEVADGRGAVDVLVVGRVDFDLSDIGLDHFRVVADRLDVEETEAVILGAVVVDELAAVTACVGSVENL